MNEIHKLCDFYIELGWCKMYNNRADQFESFLSAIYRFSIKKEMILANIMHKSPSLRRYMMIHSVFPVNVKKRDWLVKFMIQSLYPSDKYVEQIIIPKDVPEHIINKFAIFNPKPVGLEMEPVRIMYGMWQSGFAPPINIIDTDFENTGTKRLDVAKEIYKYDDIIVTSDGSFKYTDEVDHELPF